MSRSVKVLLVRDYFSEGKLLNAGLEFSTATVIEITPERDLSLGFARIANVEGNAVFKLVQSSDAEIALTPELSAPHTLLNGEVITSEGEAVFNLGDTVITYGCYQRPYYVTRDTVVLVPPQTPAQLLA